MAVRTTVIEHAFAVEVGRNLRDGLVRESIEVNRTGERYLSGRDFLGASVGGCF